MSTTYAPETETIRAIGWRLRTPSATGGKVYVIAAVSRFLIVGWSSERTARTGMQFVVKATMSPLSAQHRARMATVSKESKGYVLDVPPHALSIASANKLEALASMVGQRGCNPYLQESVNSLFDHGSLV